jgi:hypothetical protein
MSVAAILGVSAWAGTASSARPHRPKPDLVVQSVTASVTSGQLTASAQVKNKGSKKAKVSSLALFASRDTNFSPEDTPLGSVGTPVVKPKKTVTVGVVVPAPLLGGSYFVIACADSSGSLREAKEGNNCTASAPVTFPTPVTVAYSTAGDGFGYTSLTGAATGGTCTAAAGNHGGSCAVTGGASTVTITARNGGIYEFHHWSGTCTGTATSLPDGSRITVTNPTTNQSCVANFYDPHAP